jgi:large subunit ribosomal protein L13
MKTYMLTHRDLEHRWHLVDASGVVLGRLASEVARLIRGKHKPAFTPHMDCGDYVVVVNAGKVRLTGRKEQQKQYFRYTGYIGNQRLVSASEMLAKHPERVVEKAVFGMLPKGTLGRQALRHKLKVYAGPDHPHQAQQPHPIEIRSHS